jgi:hypothetical protein
MQTIKWEKNGKHLGFWIRFNKLNDPTWYDFEFGHGELALDIFFDLIRLSNNKRLSIKLY